MPKNASGLKSLNVLVRNYLFLKTVVTSVGAVTHNVLYNQKLLIICSQVSF